MKRYQLYIFDLDGTLYRGAEAIPHAADVVKKLREGGAQICYLTNNSSQTQKVYRNKLESLGFQADLKEIYSSASGCATHLGHEEKKTVFAVGMPGLITTLEDAGIEVVNRNSAGHATHDGRQAEAVVAGICLEFTYQLMAGAMAQLGGGAEFIATNTDATFPLEGGKFSPGAGSIVAGIQTCSGKVPFVVGKPNPFLVKLILQEKSVSASNALCVGDRLDTDIASGVAAGTDTHLVLTGVETSAPVGQASSEDLRGLIT